MPQIFIYLRYGFNSFIHSSQTALPPESPVKTQPNATRFIRRVKIAAPRIHGVIQTFFK